MIMHEGTITFRSLYTIKLALIGKTASVLPTEPSRDFGSPSRARAEPSLPLEVNEPSRAYISQLDLKPSRAEPMSWLGSGLDELGSVGSVKYNGCSECLMCYKSLRFSVTMTNVRNIPGTRETSGVRTLIQISI
jgi:hypothetical protein